MLAMPDTPSFVVHAPRYRPNSGGAIVTHKLCDVLNRLGYPCSLFPHWMPSLVSSRAMTPRSVAYLASALGRPVYTTNPAYRTPLATAKDLTESIVIYPEIIGGNPLGADRYVRWLLHQPDFHGGTSRYRSGDLYFCIQEAFNQGGDGMAYGGLLNVTDMMLDVYRQTNFGPRTRVAYMIRKGRDREDLTDLSGEWVLDGLDHRAMAEAFNECRVCYFYDGYTAYSDYAAACGCIPVVVPLPGIEKQQWVPEAGGRSGVAYGEADIPHALATRDALLAYMRGVEGQNLASVRRFISVVAAHFGLQEPAGAS